MKKMLFRLDAAKDLREHAGQPWLWSLEGETIEGKKLTMRTSRVGRNEMRWFPTNLIGEVLQLTYHETRTGNLMADLWRPHWAEGRDLRAEFNDQRTLYRVEQERQALLAESQAAIQHVNIRQALRRV